MTNKNKSKHPFRPGKSADMQKDKDKKQPAINPFEKTEKKTEQTREEIDGEQKYKEASTERD